MQSPILLIADDVPSFPFEAFQRKLGIRIVRVSTRRAALAALRKREFSLVIADAAQAKLESPPIERLVHNAGVAPVLEVDFKSASLASLVHQIRREHLRIKKESERVRATTIATLQGQLREPLSGLLLESQLALRLADARVSGRLTNIVALARKLSEQLQLPGEAKEGELSRTHHIASSIMSSR
jgi:hypothetical protein